MKVRSGVTPLLPFILSGRTGSLQRANDPKGLVTLKEVQTEQRGKPQWRVQSRDWGLVHLPKLVLRGQNPSNEFPPNWEQAGAMLDCAGGPLPATLTQSPTPAMFGFANTLYFKMSPYFVLDTFVQHRRQGRHSAREAWCAWQDRSFSRICVSKADFTSIVSVLSLLDPLQEVTRQETFTAGDSDALVMASPHHAWKFWPLFS